MSNRRRFKQVDVFSVTPFNGNPVAVVIDAEGLSESQMQAISRWTNLSETTFVLPPSVPQADYQVKIYSLGNELQFAGHPTLGTAYALLDNVLKPKVPGQLIQQCGIGNIVVSIADDGMLAFKAPEATITLLPQEHYSLLVAAAGGDFSIEEKPAVMVNVGICWLMVEVSSAEICLNLRPDITALANLLARCGAIGVTFYGRHAADNEIGVDFEMRSMIIDNGCLVEDPACGSANACLARLLSQRAFAGNPVFAKNYKVRQGTCKKRDGRIYVNYLQGEPWIGGYSMTVIDGYITL